MGLNLNQNQLGLGSSFRKAQKNTIFAKTCIITLSVCVHMLDKQWEFETQTLGTTWRVYSISPDYHSNRGTPRLALLTSIYNLQIYIYILSSVYVQYALIICSYRMNSQIVVFTYLLTRNQDLKNLTSLFQSARNVTQIKMTVCVNVPPIIPNHIPCMHNDELQHFLYPILKFCTHQNLFFKPLIFQIKKI